MKFNESYWLTVQTADCFVFPHPKQNTHFHILFYLRNCKLYKCQVYWKLFLSIVSCTTTESDKKDTTAAGVDKDVADTDDNKTETETELVKKRPSEHVVADRETVTSIAAMYDITPSELVQTNKLGMSRMVFPGQVR